MDHPTPQPRNSGSASRAATDFPPVLTRLQDEWRHLSISLEELRTVHRWALPGSLITNLDDVLRRCGYSFGGPGDALRRDRARGWIRPDSATREGDSDVSDPADAVLLHLLRLAPTEALAARIVLQRILPPLCAVARRHTVNQPQRRALMDDLVANAWPIICRYPVDRRPTRIVPNLVRDITFETVVRPSRRRQANEIPTDTADLGEPAAITHLEPIEELVALLRDAAHVAGVQPGDVAFICQLINHGRPEHLAVTLDVTPRTVRNHRDAVVHRLRTLVACAA